MDANIDTGGLLEKYHSECSQCKADETALDCIDNGFSEEVRNLTSNK